MATRTLVMPPILAELQLLDSCSLDTAAISNTPRQLLQALSST